ncbi:hypothetical protein N4R57_04825 [Rhodobacteraceae bacterium D3-12]|nr:hypothetical protein N4R57_04825 [Rhodobacteraceae bacterium D3-12]
MIGIGNMFGAGRQNTSALALGVVFLAAQLVLISWLMVGGGNGFFGGDSEVDVLDRPALTSHLPKSLPGWHKRSYLRSDGEAITAGAKGRGLDARLAMGADLEQFLLYEQAGINAATAVYVKGDYRTVVAIMRGAMKMPPWLEESSYSSADWAAKVAGLHEGKIAAIVQGLAFERRDIRGVDGKGIGYDRYVARIGHELTIDVISNAPQADVETLLARIDGVALKRQLPEDSPAISADFGLALYHLPETWPERLDMTGTHKLKDWIVGQ